MVAGSSPLARGLRLPRLRGDRRQGIIPARAGFTRRRSRPRPSCQDHPRSRGVYVRFVYVVLSSGGSSPLARGLLRVDTASLSGRRIIPARAGFTPISRSCPCWSTDHPRSRGVYLFRGWVTSLGRGSSPLARGLPISTPVRPVTSRIIPARAGFTRHPAAESGRGQDHPRSRGVYQSRRLMSRAMSGSSPLARGLPRFFR